MYKEQKPMLNAKELIEHLSNKGIKFELINKQDAEDYLRNNNNYFKLVSYRKNFPKYDKGVNEGKYIDLDFGMLEDLSIIDMRLRKTLLGIVLDLEHYVKVKILSAVERDTKDGYTFDNWYSDEALTTAWDFDNNTVTKNVTLYAKWNQNSSSSSSSSRSS